MILSDKLRCQTPIKKGLFLKIKNQSIYIQVLLLLLAGNQFSCIRNLLSGVSINTGGSLTSIASLVYEECVNAGFDRYSDANTNDIRNFDIPGNPSYPNKIFLCGLGTRESPYRILYKGGLLFLMGKNKYTHALSGQPYTAFVDGSVKPEQSTGLHFKLMGTENSKEFDFENDEKIVAPIGGEGGIFKGYFNGNGVPIMNLIINSLHLDNVGLFRKVIDSQISNMALINVQIKGRNNVGSLIGWASNSEIINSYATWEKDLNSTQVLGQSNVGGLVGWATGNRSRISSSYSFTRVYGSTNVGGLVGVNDREISDSYTLSPIYGDNSSSNMGGFVGRNTGTISNVYSLNVLSVSNGTPTAVGGFIGNGNGGNVRGTNFYFDDRGLNLTNRIGSGVGSSSCLTCRRLELNQFYEMSNFATWEDAKWSFSNTQLPQLRYDKSTAPIISGPRNAISTIPFLTTDLLRSFPNPSFTDTASPVLGNTTISLGWTHSDLANVQRYEMRESVNGIIAFHEVIPTSSTTITYTGKVAGIPYLYQLRACGVLLCSNWIERFISIPSRIDFMGENSQAPQAVTGMTDILYLYYNNSFTVSWAHVPGATSYNFEESKNDQTWTAISLSPSNINTYTRTGLDVLPSNATESKNTFRYRLRSCVNTTCTAWSTSQVLEIRNAPPPTLTALGSICQNDGMTHSINWTAGSGAQYYEVSINNTSGINVGNTNSASMVFPTSGNNTIRVRACSYLGNCGSYSSSKTINVLPPTNGGTITRNDITGTLTIPACTARVTIDISGGGGGGGGSGGACVFNLDVFNPKTATSSQGGAGRNGRRCIQTIPIQPNISSSTSIYFTGRGGNGGGNGHGTGGGGGGGQGGEGYANGNTGANGGGGNWAGGGGQGGGGGSSVFDLRGIGYIAGGGSGGNGSSGNSNGCLGNVGLSGGSNGGAGAHHTGFDFGTCTDTGGTGGAGGASGSCSDASNCRVNGNSGSAGGNGSLTITYQ